jgi:hypothetical protein
MRLLGSRYGIAAILLLAVIAVVVIAKANSDPNPGNGVNNGSTYSDDAGSGAPNDGMEDPGSDAKPSSNLPAKAVDNAKAFTKAYIDTDKSQKDWFAGISPYLTGEKKQELKQTDPSRVPIKEIRGKPELTGNNVNFQTDAGLLLLRMVEQDGKWLVDGIDFQNP